MKAKIPPARAHTMRSEPATTRGPDLISELMAELSTTPDLRKSSLTRGSNASSVDDLITLKKVQVMVEKVELVVRAWTKERGTGMQSLILGIRNVLEKELKKELTDRKNEAKMKDAFDFSIDKKPTLSDSLDIESDKSAILSDKSRSRPSSSSKRFSTVPLDSQLYQLTVNFTDTVKRFLSVTKSQSGSLTPSYSKAKQEVSLGLGKLEEKLAGVKVGNQGAGMRFSTAGRVFSVREAPSGPTPDQLSHLHSKTLLAIEHMANSLAKSESSRLSSLQTSLNTLFSKVTHLHSRLLTFSIRHKNKLKRQKTLRNSSISSLSELHGEVKSLKQLIETCLPASPRVLPSITSFDQWSDLDFAEKMQQKDDKIAQLEGKISHLNGILRGFDAEKWGELQLELIRLSSQLEVTIIERDKAINLALQWENEWETRVNQTLLMVKEDWSGRWLRVQEKSHQEIQTLQWRIWQLEDVISHLDPPIRGALSPISKDNALEERKTGLKVSFEDKDKQKVAR